MVLTAPLQYFNNSNLWQRKHMEMTEMSLSFFITSMDAVVCSSYNTATTIIVKHNEPNVLSSQKTDLGSRGDLVLLVYDLHGISSGL